MEQDDGAAVAGVFDVVQVDAVAGDEAGVDGLRGLESGESPQAVRAARTRMRE
ncbi:hypothetical protein [Nannocystis pusilla]|uniref:hypothetical protein n=1 Tax=Nannocystis pusilla TaxID=889268 RepID=UPI003B7BD841